jgi:NifU-like protein involved in Fe-S cluster formation
VSVMHANNEIGVIQDIRAIGEICRERDIAFHVDGAQSVGKLPVDVRSLPVDLLSFTAHKLYGPKGIGALYVRPSVRARLRALQFGGGQERRLRPGTLPTHQIVGFGVACELAAQALATEPARLQGLRDRMWTSLSHLNGVDAPRLPGILNVSFEGVEGESLVASLPSLAVSTGSACSSATGDPSYVLRALGRGVQLAQASLRFSFGRLTTEEDVDAAAHAVQLQVERLRALSPAADGPWLSVEEAAILARAQAADPRAASTANQGLGAPAAANAGGGGGPEGAQSLRQREGIRLSCLARELFERPCCSGRLAPGQGILVGEAGSPAAEAWVRFHVAVSGAGDRATVRTALFQAWGCPHTLAVAAWLAPQLAGRSIADLVPGTPSAWLEALEVPVEKLGRLLVIEDALKAVLRAWQGRGALMVQ